jgi:dolichyl-diphosphooligosaccharide--protein glycosyltransferase
LTNLLKLFFDVKLDYKSPAGFDRTRNMEIGNKNIKLEHLEEAYTTEHWLVRIYKVKDLPNRERIAYADRKVKGKLPASKKTSKKRRGTIKYRPEVVKGKRATAV